MSDSVAPRTIDDWEPIFERFHASGQSQAAFCRDELLSRFTFSHRYQRSPQFKGKRRGPQVRGASAAASAPNGAFTPVRTRKPAIGSTPTSSGAITLHIGSAVRLECPADFALVAISQLAREAGR